MKKKLLIIGAGGHGKVVADIALKMNKWKDIAFLDDNERIKSSTGIEVVGKARDVSAFINDYDMFVGIGDNYVREKIQNSLEVKGASIPALIHPNSVIGERVDIQSGAVVTAGVVINSCAKIGKGCIINTSSSVDHDSLIESFVHISPGAHLAGAVTIGRRTWLGIGSVVSNNLFIINDSKIGAGAVVINNIIEPGTYVGIPAKKV
ncbi:acetyltransferase [Virgibacillus doumboii]|uniref:acetyltransferase n=1 Tax=Virgibacillus doumboii TaxID=2697503 RepID=UPI0013E0DE68|nr:acetyltransferase [Virgibacillus doumboii]